MLSGLHPNGERGRSRPLGCMRDVVDLHELRDFWNPAPLDKGDVVRMFNIKSVITGIWELHGEAKGEWILWANLAQAPKLLHAFDFGESTCGLEEGTLGSGACFMLETEDNGVADHFGDLEMVYGLRSHGGIRFNAFMRLPLLTKCIRIQDVVFCFLGAACAVELG
jgi:hypothetical protein